MQEARTIGILVVDDNPDDREQIQRALKEHEVPCRVVMASSVMEALECLERQVFDLLILDYRLPDGSALDVLSAAQGIPGIIITGQGDERIAATALKAGASDYIIKGDPATTLVAAIQRALQGRAAQLELVRLNEELRSFTFAVSHDLKEPLRTAGVLAGRIRGDGQCRLSDRSSRDLQRIARAAERGLALIGDLLEYAKTGRRAVRSHAVDLRAIAQEVANSLAGSIREAGASVELSALPTVPGDADLLYQLFQNLLSNALKFRRPQAPLVEVRAEASEGGFIIRVSDNGIGIPEELRGRLFQPFVRLERRTEFEGSGLGLASCKRIVEAHGGRIGIESEPGRGTCVWFWLPAPKPFPTLDPKPPDADPPLD